MFTAFHHFKPEDAKNIIKKCLSNGQSLTIFEFKSRYDVMSYVMSVFGLFYLIFVPFVAQKWGWRKFIFTTLIPIIPFVSTFDGIVSNLRTYTKSELQYLAQQAFPDKIVKMDYQQVRFSLFFKSYMCHFYLENE